MKQKLILIFTFAYFFYAQAQEGFHVGLKFSPSLAWSRISPSESFLASDDKNYTFSSNGLVLRYGFGGYAEYFFNDNFALTSGINFVTNASGFTLKNNSTNIEEKYVHNLSSLQIPLGLKILTNEVASATKLYFQPAISGDIIISTSINGKSEYNPSAGVVKSYSELTNTFASMLHFSTGIEYEISGNLKLTAGITYSRGITNILSEKSRLKSIFSDSQMQNDYFSLDLGVKF